MKGNNQVLIQMPVRNVTQSETGAVRIVLNREQIGSGDIVHAFRSLLPLIDHRDSVIKHAGALSITVRGYDDEPGLLCEIPAVRKWMTSLTEQFPYWIHFCVDEDLILILSLIAPISIERRISTETIRVRYPLATIEALLGKMIRHSLELYAEVGIPGTTVERQRMRMQTLGENILADLR